MWVQGAPRTRSAVLGSLEALKATQCGSLFSKNLHSVQHVPCVVGKRSSEQSLGSLGSGLKNIWMQMNVVEAGAIRGGFREEESWTQEW